LVPIKGEVIIFKHKNFRGHHRHIINKEENLNHSEDNSLNDEVSSLRIISGTWEFCKHKQGGAPYKKKLGPGAYPWVVDEGIQNDQISSLRETSIPW